MGGVAQAMKRIPRIKFPQRHPKPSSEVLVAAGASAGVIKMWDLEETKGSASQDQVISTTGDAPPAFFSRAAPSNMSVGGKASLQPKRTPLSKEEIEAIMLGGCI